MNAKPIIPLMLCLLAAHPPATADHPGTKRDPVPVVEIPAGDFLRGSPPGTGRQDERPRRTIYLDTFLIDRYEVTNARYFNFVASTGHKEPLNVYGEGSIVDMARVADLPVIQVTWHDAADYCRWAGKRLPTEAEWEKAARGADGRRYPWGNTTPSTGRANFDRDWVAMQTLLPGGSLPDGASPYGVHDMAGNAREWVQDWYADDYYRAAASRNPRGPETGVLKVIRGGSWHSPEQDIRTVARGKGGFALKTHGTGFRCAQDGPARS